MIVTKDKDDKKKIILKNQKGNFSLVIFEKDDIFDIFLESNFRGLSICPKAVNRINIGVKE